MTKKIPSRIIIVDDDKNTCESMADILTLENFQVSIAHDGNKAIELFQAQQFDAAILDIKLPDIDGLILLERLQKIQPNIITIFVTGHASVDYARKALLQGASGFFVKPLIIKELLQHLYKSLEKQALIRRCAETAIELQNIIGASSDAILSLDVAGQIRQANKAAEHVFGYSPEEFTKMNIHALLWPEKERDYKTLWEEYCNSKLPQELETINKQGECLNLEISIGRHLETGSTRYTLIIRDVSARKKDEREKKKLHDHRTQASKMEAIGTLAWGIAHDFNNILAAILGYSKMVNETMEEGCQNRHDMEQIISAGLRAKELVQQILTFSRKSEEKVQPVQVSTILKEVLALLRSSIPKSIEIVQEIKNKNAVILINPVQLHQVVMNLCINGYHAMPDGGTLRVILDLETDSGCLKKQFPKFNGEEYLKLVVQDSGTGISSSLLKKIFEPYFTTKRMGEGSGMGLSTTQGIVVSAGGSIRVETEQGRGSIFTVYLPTLDTNQHIPLTRPDSKCAVGSEHILLVDDEIALAELNKRILERLGYQVSSFFGSNDALEAFQGDPKAFDLVLTDFSMPGMTGVQLAGKIHEIRPEIPIILNTGCIPPQQEKEILARGIKAILNKPLVHQQLSDTIRKILDKT